MKRWMITATVVASIFVGTGADSAVAQGTPEGQSKLATSQPLPNCPVMGEPIDFSTSVATDDGPVYFCCQGCIKKYEDNPKKYAKPVAAQRSALAKRAKVQVICPVSGEVPLKEFVVEHNGEKVTFCCNGCVGKFQKNPAKYKSALSNSYTFQTKCPVMGGNINPETFTTLASGMKVYYCCAECEKPLFSEPAKYLPKLAEQGYALEAKDLKKAEASKSDEGHDDHGHDGHDHDGHGHGK